MKKQSESSLTNDIILAAATGKPLEKRVNRGTNLDQYLEIEKTEENKLFKHAEENKSHEEKYSSRKYEESLACFEQLDNKFNCLLPKSTIEKPKHAEEHQQILKKTKDYKHLWKHIESYHPEVAKAIISEERLNHGNPIKLIKEIIAGDKTLDKHEVIEKFYTKSSSKNRLIIEEQINRMAWITDSGIPFRACSGVLWKNYLFSVMKLGAALTPFSAQKEILETRTLCDSILPALGAILEQTNFEEMKKSDIISIVVDGWTEHEIYYVGIVVFFITENWNLKHQAIDLFTVPSRTAASLGIFLRLSIEKIFSNSTMIGCGVIDGAEKCVMKEAKLDFWWCVAHRIHLCVTHALEFDDNVLKKIENIVSLFHRSSILNNELLDIQVGDKKILISSSPTRWNSSYDMLSRFIDLLPFIQNMAKRKFFSDYLDEELNDWIQLPLLKMELLDLKNLLEPLSIMTKNLEGDYPTLHLVPKWIYKIQLHLEDFVGNEKYDSTARKVAQNLKNALNISYFKNFFEEPNYSLCSAALSLRYSNLPWLKDNIKSMIWDQIANECYSMLSESEMKYVSINNVQSVISSARKLLETEHERIQKERTDFKKKNPNLANDLNIAWPSPLDFWKVNVFPNFGLLMKVIKLFLMTPATSASVERYFKCAKFIDEGRDNLNTKTLILQTSIKNALNNNQLNIEEIINHLEKK